MPKLKKTLILTAITLIQLSIFSRPAFACSYNIGGVDYDGIETGLGCVPTEPTGLVSYFILFAAWTTSGIAMLLLIYGGFKIMASSGDPKAVMEGRETITSAIAGLLLVMFSVAILRIIGFNILGIEFFSR
jgi:hypothetical protein